jgi:site-specific DNA-adenine methylase
MWYSNKIGSWWYDRENKATLSFKNKVENFKEMLSKRLANTQIENNLAHKVIESRDHKQAFIFCDPSIYWHKSRSLWRLHEGTFCAWFKCTG